MLVFPIPLLTFWAFLCRIIRYNGWLCRKGSQRVVVGVAAIALLLGGCASAPVPPTPTSIDEMRGVWVSYLELDPLLAGADPSDAARRLDTLMDTCEAFGLNTVFFHVRSHSDARYRSAVYPTTEDTAALLASGFDPLAYAVEAAHARGLTLHAWINPYRIGATPPVGSTPTRFQKGGIWYYAPSDPAARQLVLDGVREILDNYAVDGIHFDDYFYPTGMAEGGEAFESPPDTTDVIRWRQTQVDTLVSAVHGLCRSHGRLFGISPMADIEQAQADGAAVTRWLTEPGYVDYLMPQLYTGFEHQTHPFDRLLARWTDLPRQNGVELYMGLALYKAGIADDPYAGAGAGEWAEHHDIIARQVTETRRYTDGFCLFRYAYLTTPAAQQEIDHLRPLLER